ncbi:MAG: RimK family alpha-L-glutamate ligase [Candidatus Aenigmarchaeota archaeon]|nr:RimK family alpha-L-glutamate ligase [Candidatus Aenigmarchaeota archaeon]
MLKKSIFITGPVNPGKSTKMLISEAEQVFKTVAYVPVNKILLKLSDKKAEMSYEGKDLSKFDYCLPRIDSKRAQHGYHVIKFMDMIDIKKPYSAETILIAHNKFMTLETLRKADIPIPVTYLIDSIDTAKSVLEKMEYPIVVKIVDSFGGLGVMMFDDKETALSAIDMLKSLRQQLIVEEFIKNPGEDIRAFVVGGKIVASMKRIAQRDETRANILLGAKAKYIKITGEMEDIALKAASASGSDIVAIDMIESPDGPKVMEININPGIKGIQKAVNINMAKIIIDFVAEEVQK